ncbi:hypothetical protein N9V83_00250 [Flavobacteriales bacterium]|jgi:hypothetical protein|nr:hypothetical protein [Flavobacteriales bacterium]
MRLVLVTIVCVAFLCSCTNKIKFVIENNTGKNIDSLNISSSALNSGKNIAVGKGAVVVYDLDMSDVPYVDGSYIMYCKNVKEPFRMKNFGYYTNGSPMEDVIVVNIEKDTILISY